MSYTIPNGSLVHIASGTGSALPITDATNAAPCVVTSTAHGLANGDFVIIQSGWGRLTDKVFRVANVAANTFELEGSDTSDTDLFPAGGGEGSGNTATEVTGWTQLTQVLNNSSSGGEQQYATFQPLEGDRELRIPTHKSASGWDVEVGDDPTLPGFVLASAANDDGVARAVRITNKNSSKTMFFSYIGVDKIPKMDVNAVQTCRVNFSHLNEPVRYAS